MVAKVSMLAMTSIAYFNSYGPIEQVLLLAGNNSNIDDVMFPQVYPNISEEQYGPSLSQSNTIQVDDPVNVDIEELPLRIQQIQDTMIEYQNIYRFVGTCLRSFTEIVKSIPVSRNICIAIQILDLNYMKAALAYQRFFNCVKADNSPVCKQGQRKAQEVIEHDIQPAQNLVARTIGLKPEELFKRELVFTQNRA